MTEFLEEHPGGDEVLLLAAGMNLCFLIIVISLISFNFFVTSNVETFNEMLELRTSSEWLAEKDATDDFEDVGHSDTAREMMEKYYVGKVDVSTLPEKRSYKPPPQPPSQSNQSSGGSVKILPFLLPLLVLAIALALHFYGKNK